MKAKIGLVAVLLVGMMIALVATGAFFTVNETQQAIKLQFGKPVGEPITKAGLHFKLPFVNNIRKFDNRILILDTNPEQMLTSEQKFVAVDSFVKWQISDVSRFYTSTQGNEAIALNRLDSIVKDRIRNQIASRTLVEVIAG